MLTRLTSVMEGMVGQHPGSSKCEKISEEEVYSKGISEWLNNLF